MTVLIRQQSCANTWRAFEPAAADLARLARSPSHKGYATAEIGVLVCDSGVGDRRPGARLQIHQLEWPTLQPSTVPGEADQ